MDEGTAARIVHDSTVCGAAMVLNTSGPLDPDTQHHHRLLIGWTLQVQTNPKQSMREHAWEEIVRGTASLVFTLARSYFHKWRSHLPDHASFDDVFNAGLLGLTVAVNKFDISRGDEVRLTTYATPWIRNHVQRACYAQCGSAHIPEHVLQAGVDPRSDLVASSTASLEAPSELDGGETLGNLAVGRESASNALVDAQSLAELVCLLRGIDKQMPQVADLLEQGYADKDIAEITGLTPTRVQQLRGEARIVLKAHGYA